MALFARSVVRLVVVLVLTGALVAVAVGSIAYSTSRLFHDTASAKEQTMPALVTDASLPSHIYAANGAVIGTLRSSLYRAPVKLAQISPILVKAVLDTEDHGFWVHGGLDVESTARALLADVNAGGVVQGGSTIAQQLVKNIYLSDQRTLTRKLREAVLAERLEEKYSKAQVLDAYLNSVYLGSGAYGVEAAAKEYFKENANQVDLPQAAMIAGLIQAPSAYDPIVNPVGARERRSEVLSRMVYYKTVTAAQASAANKVALPTSVYDPPGVSYTSYGFYVDQVVNQLLNSPALGSTVSARENVLFNGGLKIYTNEDPSLQAYAQHVAVADIPPGLDHVAAAFAVIDPKNGNVVALVGGPHPRTDQFDDAVQGERQPGSGFKLFSLIGALELGYSPYDSILATSPCAVTFPGVPLANGYNVNRLLTNDAGDPNGVVTLVQATALSINCAYLRLAHQVTLPKVIAVAKSMGLSDSTLNPDNPSLVLGTEAVRPIEMSAAYATVADGGVYHTPTFVSRVVDRTGSVIYNGEQPGRRVFSQQIADEAIVALTATVQYGTGTAAELPNADVAGKTGTTDNSVDAWFNGITPTLVASVWMGNPNGEVPMYVNGVEVYGADYPTQIWHDVMDYALKDVPYSAFPAPNPDLIPPAQYIISPSLEEDDLLSHDGVGAQSCVYSGEIVPCPTTTLPPPPPTTVPVKSSSPPPTVATPTTSPPTPSVPAPANPGAGGPVTTFAIPTSSGTLPGPPTTAPPTTPTPTTAAPTTAPPTTATPTTAAPTTSPPATAPPATAPPATASQSPAPTALPPGFGAGGAAAPPGRRVGQQGGGPESGGQDGGGQDGGGQPGSGFGPGHGYGHQGFGP